MDPLLQLASRLADEQPVDTLVHVGPGDPRLLQAYLALAPRRVAWIDDEPERLAALREAAAAAGATALVTLTPERADTRDGQRDWRRCAVPALEGPLALGEAAGAYPGAADATTGRVTVRALDALVAPHLEALPPGARGVLVLDLPGRERALLSSLSPRTVDRIGTLLLRGCARAFFVDGSTLDETVGDLREGDWRVHARDASLSWWPAVVLARDDQLRGLSARMADAERARLAAEAAGAQHAARATEWEARATSLAGELETWRTELARRDALHRELLDQSLAVERAQLAKAREETERLSRERAALKTQVEQLTRERSAQKSQVDQLAREKAALVQQREGHVASLADSQKRIHRLEGAAEEAARHQRVLQESLARAEGQLAVLRDLLMRD